MAVARVHTWSAGEVLLASDLNAEFNNVLNNGTAVAFPATAAVSMGGFALNFDVANTIALTGGTSSIILSGGVLREGAEDSITAFATGGQTNATALSATKSYHRISVCATAADSVKLPSATVGQAHYVRNDGAAACQVYGTSPDTINGVATGTGVSLPASSGVWFVCTTAAQWTSTSAGGATLSANSFTGTQTVNATSAFNESKTTVASATTPDIWTNVGNVVDYTGTTTATGFAAAPQAGVRRTLVCAGAAPFTAGANVLIDGYASGATYTAAAGDKVHVIAVTTTQFRLTPALYNAWQTLTDGVTINWDTSLGAFGVVTLGGNRTLAAPTLAQKGKQYTLVVTQDGTGGRTLAFNAAFLSVNGAIPNPASGIASVTTYVFQYDGATFWLTDPAPVPRGYIDGLIMSTAGASTTLTVAAGLATDGSTSIQMALASSLGKTTSNWAVGNAQGGLDTGAIANSTWYYFWLIQRPDTGVADVLFSLSATAPTMPTSYRYKRYIGAAKTNGSGQWTKFIQDADSFTWDVPVNDVSTANPGTAAVTATITVPPGVRVQARNQAHIIQATTATIYGLISDLSITDTTPTATLRNFGVVGSNPVPATSDIWTWTNTSGQWRYRIMASGASDTVNITTFGWRDKRGRDA